MIADDIAKDFPFNAGVIESADLGKHLAFLSCCELWDKGLEEVLVWSKENCV